MKPDPESNKTTQELPLVDLPMKPVRSCRRHINCDLVDALAERAGKKPPVHCNNPNCENERH